ncbi:MAG: hypothetical protein NC429_16580, partial [Lachnospiraceae bacterium]|nr:hypothetical protein [Lachnospiraceae bacterium]
MTEQFGLLNKSFRDIKKDFANGLGVKNSLFQTSISKTDYQALQKFNSAIEVTNDGLTKSQRITKAWNENMTGCSIAAKRMGNDLVTGKKNIQDVSNAMNTASVSTKALGVAMNVMANVGFVLAITAITKVISELAQAQEHAIQSTKEATETYMSELDFIADYKKKLSELHEELKSGNLSYEETKTKRTELMSIQDELIGKFGNEKNAIESVTEAINGQVDALDKLNEKAYRDWVAKADERTFWNKLLPWGKSGLDQAIDYMETEKTVSFMDMRNANLSEEIQAIQKEIDETIQTKYNLDKTFAMFNVTGTPDEIKSQLEAIRQDYIDISEDVFYAHGITDRKLWEEYRRETIDSINKIQNTFDEGLEKHQQTYQTYIEGLIKYDSEYSDEYANILQKRAQLESAQNSGNKEEVQKAKQEFMDAINDSVIASASDEPIKKYFESLYPELQSEFSKWAFEFDLEANVKGLDDTAKEIGEKYTATDLLGIIDDESAVIADSAFNSLIDKAIEYGICTDKSADEVQKLIDLLVELGIVQDNVKGDTFNLENPISIPTLSSSISTLATQLEPQFTKLGEAYNEVFQTDDNGNRLFSPEAVDNSMLEGLRKSFAEIEEEIGVTFDAEQLEPFFAVLTDGSSTADEVQQAFNDLATAYLYSTGALEQLNDETANAIKQQLKQMGVSNAEEVVTEALAVKNEELALSKKYLALEGKELAEATDTEALAFMAEQAEVGNCSTALAALQLKKLLVNGTMLDTEADIQNVMRFAQSAGIATESLAELITLKAAYEKAETEGYTTALSMVADRMEVLKQDFLNDVNSFELDPVNIEFNPPDSSKSSASSSAAKQAET